MSKHVPYLPEFPEGTKRSIEAARKRSGYTTKAGYLRDVIIRSVADDLGISEKEVIDGRVGAFKEPGPGETNGD